jgi:exopolysaccharide biosynthesis polyprenyl glycosylphosphotransferase
MHCCFAVDHNSGESQGIGNVFGSAHHLTSNARARSNRFALTHHSLARAAFAIEFVGILLTAIATGVAYQCGVHGEPGSLQTYFSIGSVGALAYCLVFLVRDEYEIESFFDGSRRSGRIFLAWNLIFVPLAVVGFLTRETEIHRGWLIVFYFAGAVCVLVLNAAIARGLGVLISFGRVRVRRLMVVATESDFASLQQEIASHAPGVTVADRVIIEKAGPNPDEIERALDAAVANARAIGIEDVFISDAFSHHAFLERTLQALTALPVAIHLSAGGLIGRFKHARALRFGTATALSLTRRPLGPLEATTKRWFDITVSAIALVLLSPLFAIIALLIKCDSPGPIFFRQQHSGYNTAEFRTWKFRTTVAEDGDARTTTVGAFLRRFSLDELPQLINVFKGEMSLVGPCPHAVVHDRFLEGRISAYPRYRNVKPGITGWAQVNGFRGTDRDDAMRGVPHDIFYVDNYSLGFDLYILLLTLISPKANRDDRGGE